MQSDQTAAAPVSDASSKRSARRRQLLDVAARKMNRDGAASVTPSAIAAATGMTRNALYYYYRDKDSLLYSCYLAGARHLEDAARSAASDAGSPAARLTQFMQTLMATEQDFAILHDLDLLPPADAETIRTLQKQSLDDLASIFTEGERDGSLRSVPPLTAAHVLLGMADWARLWQTWATTIDDAAARADHQRRCCETILTTLLQGFSPSTPGPRPPPDVGSLIDETINVLDRRSLAGQKRLAILGVASRLFNRRGIAATSIDDIAEAAEATKGLIYHHFKSKSDLVDACYDRAFDLYECFADTAEAAAGVGAIESLTWPMHLSTQALLSRTPPLMLQAGVSALPERHRKRAIALATRFRADMAVAMETGVADAASMPFTELSAGAFFWIPRWHAEAEAVGAYRLGDQIVDLLTRGVLRNPQWSR